MINELDSVVLTTDIPEHGLTKGDIVNVVMVHEAGQGFEVEFVTLDGETIAVVSLFASQVDRSPRNRTRPRSCGVVLNRGSG
jgi:hypothetical protein